MMKAASRTLLLLVAACLCLASPLHAADYQRHLVGDPALPTPGATSPGLLLMGGGDRNHAALRWFLDKAGNGHVVVLRASFGGEIGEEFHDEVGGVASAETFVFSGRAAADDPALLASLARADGIFIAGGDQSRYVRFWRDTPVAAALQAHVRAGKPLGGTSAGLAILGEFIYGAMDDGSLRSPEALADPLGAANTIERDLLDIDLLAGVVTDTHFTERDRLGRLVAFVAKAESMADGRAVIGLGVDEDAALAVEGDGRARVFATSPGSGATVVRGGFAEAQRAGTPLRLARVDTIGVGTASTLHLPEGRVDAPAFRRSYHADGGRLEPLATAVLAIHGGAGVERAGMTADDVAAARAALERALRAGHARLEAGAPALEVVGAAITVLEDAPMFNAGRGAVFTHDGRNELDASLMDGASGRAGAVAGVQRVRNPILLARAVMEHSPHVMMVGAGAEAFAGEQGVTLVEPAYFHTDKRWEQLQRALREDAAGQAQAGPGSTMYFGTVGAVALDGAGHLAAGTSTGGMTNKRYGRVGDSPIIGAGTWADAACAVSGTGWGEYYIRTAAAHEICARVRHGGEDIRTAAEGVINGDVVRAGGDGGAIALDAGGTVAFPFNTEGMFRGWIGTDGVPHVAVFAEDALPAVGE
ncbi:isoaspartyl peptidase/L-asparaginase [Luteimonas sp. MC1782]|nr:isoaspartyl peptidase/L-asparaginase [Luteimonas sp. MC1782]